MNKSLKEKENEMEKQKSSIPGLVYPSIRKASFKTAEGFLDSRREDDGAEGYWRVRNGLYDLEKFAKTHPGGAEWIRMTKGTDITELFESHHLTDRAENLLPKFYVRDATLPRSTPLTFKPDGFYRTFKKRALEALQKVDFHHPSTKSNLIADSLFLSTILFSLIAAISQSYIAVIAAGICLSWTATTGHNYFHMRDNFRMYYFDLSTMSSKDWRITHVMSHHMYPNTLWDHEIYAVEPFLTWMPQTNKSYIFRILSQLYSPVIWAFLIAEQTIKRYYTLFQKGNYEFRDIIPFFLPAAMSLVAPNVGVAIKLWLLIIMVTSLVFAFTGFNAAHHHPDIFHDGDFYRDDLDWGLLELDAVRDREVIDDNAFLVLTNFGSHALHHLLPTVDHSYLPLAFPAFLQTCKEFGVYTDRLTQWELIKGQFQQLTRVQPKKNSRAGK